MDKFGFGKSRPQENPYARVPVPQSEGNYASPPPGYRPSPPGGHSPAPGGVPGHGLRMVIDNAPDSTYATDNVIAVPPGGFQTGQYIIVDDNYVFTAKVAPQLPPGVLGASGAQREWAQWSRRDEVTVAPFDIFANGNGRVYLGSLEVEIDFYNKARAVPTPFEQDKLTKRFIQLYKNQVFAPGQKLAMEYGGINFKVKILSTQVVDLGSFTTEEKAEFTHKNARGILVDHTDISFYKPQGGLINLKSADNKPRVNAILQPNFRFEDMGIGGLDEEFNTIFRRAFASRIYPPRDVEKLGINHVKGLLLFGPPGTGKTLIARQIGKMLNAVEPKIVNGPEMLNKYVGGSEENIRKLFKEAETEYREKGEESNLHIIIFDELDAVFKQRGSRGDGTGVGDNVVNQLLAKMDGVDQLNNILVIGMTNRRDLIDTALLRPGRFEVQLEISLPDESGRRQIYKIHTSKMRHEKKLASDVKIEELAALSKNYSGAEIEGVVKSAASFALNRNIKMDPKKGITFDNKEVMVSRQDFLNALSETKPAFGVSEEDLENTIRGGIIKYASHVDDVLNQGTKLIEQVRQSDQFPLISVLVHGPPGTGKTALASTIALSSGFPFIRMISPDAMIGMSEANRIQHLSQMFQDSYKSPLNVLVVDSIEDMLDWVEIGPRFSNPVLQTLKVFLKKLPPKDRRLIVLCTSCQRSVLEQMDLLKCFNREIYVPNISSLEDLHHVFEQVEFLTPQERQDAIRMISEETGSSVLGTGIKQVLFNIEAARLSGQSSLKEFVDMTVRSINDKPGRIRGL
uniref:Vesicular-fusion protein SEC18 n=1 Tax=Blastobotrys adeninivorans TaxID=409370 RepID=A0A060T7S1_BLAAD